MARLTRFLQDEAATLALGRDFAGLMRQGGVIFLQGTLGAGKTTFTRGLLQALGHEGAVKSPTYTLVEPYSLEGMTVYHFDLYRLGDPEELAYMGIRDYFLPGNLCILEWPSKGEALLPPADIQLSLQVQAPGRTALLEAFTPQGQAVLKALAQEAL